MKKNIVLAAILMCVCLNLYAQKGKTELKAGVNAHFEVTINTSVGAVELELYNDTPLHRDNFVKLVENGFYNHLLFHRVIKDFMLQCGDPKSREANATAQYGDDDAGYKLPAEIQPHYYHKKGALAAAREPDKMNPDKVSSGSHFYIVVGRVHNDSSLIVAKERIAQSGGVQISADREAVYKTEGGTPHLDGSYTIFGKVTKGLKVAEKICKVETFPNNRPKVDVFIKSATVKLVADKQPQNKQ